MREKKPKTAAALDKERAKRKKLWLKLIKKWESEKIDRTQFSVGTLDDQPAFIDMTNEPVSARIEMLMKLRWLNYGPEALYGRMERVWRRGTLDDK